VGVVERHAHDRRAAELGVRFANLDGAAGAVEISERLVRQAWLLDSPSAEDVGVEHALERGPGRRLNAPASALMPEAVGLTGGISSNETGRPQSTGNGTSMGFCSGSAKKRT
jgi:hypothetical protein